MELRGLRSLTNPTLYFKVEEWSRLSESVQIKLCATRKVILTDYDDRTTGEKAREIIRKFNLTNFNNLIIGKILNTLPFV